MNTPTDTILEAVAARLQEIASALEMAQVPLHSPITILAMLAHVNGMMLSSVERHEEMVMGNEERLEKGMEKGVN